VRGLLAALLALSGGCGTPVRRPTDDEAGGLNARVSALTADDCRAGASGGKVGLCHAIGTDTFSYLTVDINGCINGHTHHAADFVSSDPSCRRCVPTTCAQQAAACGQIADGCGGTLTCGSCSAPATCGGGGVPNVCGAPPPRNCQQLMWRRALGGPGDDVAMAVATDGDGNVYVGGRTQGLDGVPVAGAYDAFLTKLDAAGNVLWTRQFGSTAADQALGVATAPGGLVYVSGVTEGSLPGNVSAGGSDLFLAQFDAAGDLGWLRQQGSAGGDVSYGVAADGAGNAFLVGDTAGSLQAGVTNTDTDLVVIKFDGAGTPLWTRQLGSQSALPFTSAGGRAIATMPGGGVVVAGITQAGSFDGQSGLGSNDVVLVRFDDDGNRLWSVQDGTSEFDFAHGVASDAAGNVFLAGSTAGSFVGPTSGTTLMLLKYDASGSRLWARQRVAGAYTVGLAVASDGHGGVLVAGETAGSLDGQPRGGDGDDDPFLARYDGAGTWLWTQQDASPGDQAGTGVAADVQGRVFTVGSILQPADADNHRSNDVFVSRTDAVVCAR